MFDRVNEIILHDLKVPDERSSNIFRYIKFKHRKIIQNRIIVTLDATTSFVRVMMFFTNIAVCSSLMIVKQYMGNIYEIINWSLIDIGNLMFF